LSNYIKKKKPTTNKPLFRWYCYWTEW